MRILLAEDERDLSGAISEILQMSGYHVDTVYNGEDAYFYVGREDYDLLILDVMMPKMDGFEVVEKMRNESNQTPVLMLTAKSMLEDKLRGLNIGADDYLTKPFEMKELLARIKALLRRPKKYISEKVILNDTHIDKESMELVCGEERTRLNNKESQLLEFLMLNPNHLFTKEILFEKIWGLDVNSEINVVWVNISSIRKKLEDIGSDLEIDSIRGGGYRLIERKDV